MQVSLSDGDRFGKGKQVTWQLGIDPSLDTNPGIMSYIFLLCQFVGASAQPETMKATKKCTRKSAEAARALKVFAF